MIGTDSTVEERAEFKSLFNSLCDRNARLSAQELVFTLTVFKNLQADTFDFDQQLQVTNIQGGILYDDVAAQGRVTNLSCVKKI